MATGANEAEAVTALARFGLGARPGDLRAAAADPRGFLIGELRTANIALISGGGLPSCPAALQAYYEQQQKRAERAKMAAMEQARQSAAVAVSPPAVTPASAPATALPALPPQPKPPVELTLFRSEAQTRLHKQLTAPAGSVSYTHLTLPTTERV